MVKVYAYITFHNYNINERMGIVVKLFWEYV